MIFPMLMLMTDSAVQVRQRRDKTLPSGVCHPLKPSRCFDFAFVHETPEYIAFTLIPLRWFGPQISLLSSTFTMKFMNHLTCSTKTSASYDDLVSKARH